MKEDYVKVETVGEFENSKTFYVGWLETDDEWIDMAKPVEEFLHCKLIACDPNFIFRMRDGSQADVPFQFIIELNLKIVEQLKRKYTRQSGSLD